MNGIRHIITDEIRKRGVISFARFMDLTLYCPVCGYYEKEKDIGRKGDFFTNVTVGGVFGELLAFQFTNWLEQLSRGNPKLRIVEAGAHDGTLAMDILQWMFKHRSALFDRLEYCIIEPSETRRVWQRERLERFVDAVSWCAGIEQLDGMTGDVCGIIFSNELLDAMPVHRFGWDARAGNWFEWGVAQKDDKFVWVRMHRASSSAELPQVNGELLEVLPDGFTLESCPAAANWWRDAAECLGEGKLVTLDYGLELDELIRPERSQGTLRAYARHHVSADLLDNPGEQDLTAHVNFTAIQRAGEAAGLQTESLMSQEKFFTSIAAKTWEPGSGFGEWTVARRRQLQTLVHPEHLGRPFRVLVQRRERSSGPPGLP